MPAILTTLFSRAGLIGMAIAAVVGVILVQTLRLDHAKSDLAKIEAAQKLAEADVKTHESTAGAITVQAASGLAEARSATTARFAPLIKRIPYDVPPEADVDCRPGPGFVSLWNAGAASVDPSVSAGAGGSEIHTPGG